jgi:hypothetical protein
MRKYRIVELRFGYYPQEKHWFSWKYIDHLNGDFLWSEKSRKYSKCDTLEHAMRSIERRKEWLKEGSKFPIYHEIL